MTMSLVGI